MKRLSSLTTAFLSAAILAACGGNNGISSSTPLSVAPQIAAPQSAAAGSAEHFLGTSLGAHSVKPGAEKVLYSFNGGTDGALPIGPGLINVNGTLYGTTGNGGGTGCGGSGCGTVFSVSRSGTEQVLYSFTGGTGDGAHPRGGLIVVNGTLYGTTASGGGTGCNGNGCGTVFSVSTSGTEQVLYRFTGGLDGKDAYSGVIYVKGTLYGTTIFGGQYGLGTVFSLSTSGTERVLHSFGKGNDGWYSTASLIDVNGTLYGTTQVGGGGGGSACSGSSNNGCGTVFSVSRSGKEHVLYRFQAGADGAYPDAGLINVNGTLYGMTGNGGGSACGGSGCGTVFSVSKSGAEHVLYSFKGGTDGAYPFAQLLNVKGVLYGTTNAGGGSGCSSGSGCGTVFDVSTSGAEQVLHSFTSSPDGAFPQTSMIDVKGALYGTTGYGGSGSCSGSSGLSGCGTVFKVTP